MARVEAQADPWPEDHLKTVRMLGPARFAEFPNHHFFVRVYRPLAVSGGHDDSLPLLVVHID